MQSFKCMMRLFLRNINFPLIYIVGFSFIALLVSSGSYAPASDGRSDGAFERAPYTYAVIDRDGSVVSASIEEVLAGGGTRVEVADERQAIQDFAAKGSADYLLIIPEGYGAALMGEGAADSEDVPQMETVYGYGSLAGAYVDQVVGTYVSVLHSLGVAEAEKLNDGSQESIQELIERAREIANTQAEASVIPMLASSSETEQFFNYLQWSMYPLFTGILVCIGVVLYSAGRVDVRRRNLASPLPFFSYNMQLVLSCICIMLIADIWVFGLGMLVYHEGAGALGVGACAMCALAVIVFSLIPASIGFMLGALGANIAIANSVGNIGGLVVSFFGGAWFPLSLMMPLTVAMAHWLPGYWYVSALGQIDLGAMEAGSVDGIALASSFAVMFLFAAAFLSAGLVAAKRRAQTSEAGGNRAAEVAI